MNFGFDLSDLSSGLNSLSNIGETLAKIKDDVENSIESQLQADRLGVRPDGSTTPKEGDGEGDWLGLDVFRSLVGGGEEASEAPTDAEPAPAAEKSPKPVEIATTAVPAEAGAEQQLDAPPAAIAAEEGPADSETIPQPAVEAPQPTPAAVEEAEKEEAAAAEPPPTAAIEEPLLARQVSSAAEAAATVAEGLEAAALAMPAVVAAAAAQAFHHQPEAAAADIVGSEGKGAPAAAEAAITLPQELASPRTVPVAPAADVSQLDAEELRAMVTTLGEVLAAREAQLQRKAQEAASVATAMEALTRKNEELVMAKAKVSEKDLEEMRAEFEGRLAAADRKAKSLTRERDSLRRSNKAADVNALLKQKDEEIRQVMEEGEALSKKQLAQETVIKQLRTRAKEYKDELETLTGRLEAAEGRSQAAASDRDAKAHEITALQEHHLAELEAERQHFERLLGEARTSAAVAEKRAEEAVKVGAARKLRDAESRVEVLESSMDRLREELERQRAAADEREDLLAAEVVELQRQCAAAEARQQELQTRLPEATAPLLRQLEVLQNTMEAQAEAAGQTERTLQEQLAAAAADARDASSRAIVAEEAVEAVEARCQGLLEQLKAAQEAVQKAEAAATEDRRGRRAAESVVNRLRSDLASAQESLATLETVYAQQMEALQAREAEAARAAAALREELQSRAAAAAANLEPQPPALAAPGFKWVMLREGEDAAPGGGGGREQLVGAASAQAEAANAAASDPQPPGSLQQQENGGGEGSRSLPGGGTPFWAVPDGIVSALAAATRSGPAADIAQLAALQRAVRDLQATRDRLSEELVRAEGEAAAGRSAAARAAELQLDVAVLQARYASAVEIVGEREERIEELAADVVDMREGYRAQISQLADDLQMCRQRVAELMAVADG